MVPLRRFYLTEIIVCLILYWFSGHHHDILLPLIRQPLVANLYLVTAQAVNNYVLNFTTLEKQSPQVSIQGPQQACNVRHGMRTDKVI